MRHYLLIALAVLSATLTLTAEKLDLRLAGACTKTGGPAEPPQLAKYGDGSNTGLVFSSTFLSDSPQRAYWDLPIDENLTHCAGIRLRFYCFKPTIARQFNVYLKTGAIWQAATFSPVDNHAWQEVFIPKTQFMPETSTAASWQKATTLRIALWKGATGRTALHLAEIEFVRPNCSVAIIRSGQNGQNLTEAYRYARAIGNALNDYGLRPAVIEQPDTTYLNLKPYSFLYYPLPAAASEAQLSTVASYLRRGGKAAVFHTLHPILQQPMGMPVGKFTSASTLPAPLAGLQMLPNALQHARNFQQNSSSFIAVNPVRPPLSTVAVWQDTAGNATPWPAIIESPAGFWMTHVFLNRDPENAPATVAAMAVKYIPALRQTAAYTRYATAVRAYYDSPIDETDRQNAKRVLNSAKSAYENGQYETVIRLSQDCLNTLANLGYDQVPPNPNELRAVWCNHDNGLPGASWNGTAQLLARNDLNALFAWTASPLAANYNSHLASVIKFPFAFANCVKACRANGVQVHAWLNCLSLEDALRDPAQKLIVQQWASEGRLQIDDKNDTIPWLCPANRHNRQLIERIAAEIAREFPVDGIHLDFIRYPSSHSCYCLNCRLSFENFISHPCQNWPQDVLPDGPQHERWLVFRQRIITSLVHDISTAARRERKNLLVSAAVYPDLQSAKVSVGQSWHAWIANQYISFVCPMNYQATTALFEAALARQKQQLGNKASQLLPGIGVSTHNLSLAETQRQIYATRLQQTAGFALFKLDAREASSIIPKLFVK